MLIRKIQQPADFPSTNVVDSYQESSSNVYNCNYINSIIDSGSNENGSWIKWSDGTMIITQTKVATTTINVADGSLYRNNLGTLPDFPIPFVERPPVVSLTITNAFRTLNTNQEGTATLIRAFDCDGGPAIIGITSATSQTITDAVINVIAIGKWK